MADPALFARFSRDFLADGSRVYLDGAATSLMPRAVLAAQRRYFETACANPHTEAHPAARASTAAVRRARALLAALLGARPGEDEVLFVGHNATAALNRAARALFPDGPLGPLRNAMFPGEAPLAVVSALEHHSNLLPWARAAGPANVRVVHPDPATGAVTPAALGAVLARERPGRVRVVAVSGASNVTGAVADVHALARVAHAHGARIVVDAAQLAPHAPVALHVPGDPSASLDAVAISGHKLYAPGAPGVLAAARALFDAFAPPGGPAGDEGGGIVESVELPPAPTRYKQLLAGREEAGTPNVAGIVGLGVVAGLLGRIGMATLAAHDAALAARAVAGLAAVPGVAVYGPPPGAARVGVVSFNVRAVPHGIVACVLADRFDIQVRSGCFCAEPYVRALLHAESRAGRHAAEGCPGQPAARRGMVRASFGPWTTGEDVARLLEAVRWVAAHAAELCGQLPSDGREGGYQPDGRGGYVCKVAPLCFDLDAEVARYVAGAAD